MLDRTNQISFGGYVDVPAGFRIGLATHFGIFNLFNFANFNLPPTTMSGLLTGSPGSLNGTTPADNNAGFRVGNGTGVYAVGAPRQIEWGLRVIF